MTTHITANVASAIDAGRPVVALESTVYSTLGLPAPHNAEVLHASIAAIEAEGATAALTAVIDGVATIGATDHDRILTSSDKVSARNLAIAMAQQLAVGVTTVGASLTLAASAGIDVFATGGIGGVHQGAELTGDISGDLQAIAAHPIVTVCAGAKSFLDLPRTLEMLETLNVAVVGWRTDRFPAFTTTDSGLNVPFRVETAAEVASILHTRQALGQGGVLVCAPPPEPIDPTLLADATEAAQARADKDAISGPERTPFILAATAELTGGASVVANTALVLNNASIAASIAVEAAA